MNESNSLSVVGRSTTEPKSVCPLLSKASHGDIRFAAREECILEANQVRRQEGKPQIRLPKGGEKKFFIIIRVEITHVLMKKAGELMAIHGERQSMHIE